MEAAFKEVKDYTCDVEQVFYQDGAESQRYRFKYYFKREKKIRVDFHYPYSSLSFFYDGGDEVIAVPFRGLGVLKFRFSIDNPKIQTLAGQKINQTDMGYFIRFLSENLAKIPSEEGGGVRRGRGPGPILVSSLRLYPWENRLRDTVSSYPRRTGFPSALKGTH